MILPASTIKRAQEEFGLTVNRLCGSNDIYCPDPTFCDPSRRTVKRSSPSSRKSAGARSDHGLV